MTDDYKERANQVSMGDSTEVSEGELEWMEDNVPSARHLVAALRSTREREEKVRQLVLSSASWDQGLVSAVLKALAHPTTEEPTE